MAALCYHSHMPYRPTEPSVSEERALLRVLGASRRVASFTALIARYKRRLPPPPFAIARPTPAKLARDIPTTVTEVD